MLTMLRPARSHQHQPAVLLRKDAEQINLFGGVEEVKPTRQAKQQQRLKERWGQQGELFSLNTYTAPVKPKGQPKPLAPKAKVGDRKVEGGIAYVFNKNYRWQRADKGPVDTSAKPSSQPTPGLAVLSDDPVTVRPAAEPAPGFAIPAPPEEPTTVSTEPVAEAAPTLRPKKPGVRSLRGMSRDEFGQFKEMAAIAIPFAKVEQNKQRYAAGNVNIKAPASQGYKFTEQQILQIADFAESVGLESQGMTWARVREIPNAAGGQGFGYLWLPSETAPLNAEQWKAANPAMVGAAPTKGDRQASVAKAESWMRSEADEKMSAFNLAQKFGIPKATAAKILKRLEGQGAIAVESTGGYASDPYYTRVSAAPALQPKRSPKVEVVAEQPPAQPAVAAEPAPELKTGIPAFNPEPSIPTDLGVNADFASTKEQKARLKINRQVKKLLKEKPKGPYTKDELTLLAKYSGKGGITDDDGSLSEYYTRPDVAKFTAGLIRQNGYKGGTVLEPSCGNGVFLHQFKDDPGTLAVGVELDSTSGAAAAALNPQADVTHGVPFERFLLDNPDFTPDAIVGNVPFGTRTVEDLEAFKKIGKGWKDNGDFFVHESLSRLKPGGTLSLIVPHGITTGSNHQRLRTELMKQGRVIGAYRLPNTAFEHTGTSTITDVLVIQKHPDAVLNAIARGDQLAIDATRDDTFIQGKYFDANPGNVLGTVRGTKNQYGGDAFTVDGSVEDALKQAQPLQPAVTYDGLDLPPGDDAGAKVGDEKYISGRLYRLEGNPPRWHLVEPEAVDTAEDADAEAYGVDSMAAAGAMLKDVGQRVMIPPDRLDAYTRLAADTLDRADVAMMRDAAIAVNAAGSAAEKEKLAHAMLLAGHVKLLQQLGTDDAIHLEQALNMLQRYRELHGNPAGDRALSALVDRFPVLLHLQGAFDDEGTISDYFANHDAVVAQAKRSHSVAGDAMAEAFRAVGGEPVTLEDIKAHLEGSQGDRDLEAALAADPTVGYMGGTYMPINRLLVGNGFTLIDALMMEAEGLPEGAPLRRKLEEQISTVRSRLQPRALEDMTTPFWAVGSWIPAEALNQFMKDRGYGLEVRYSRQRSEWEHIGSGLYGTAEDVLTTMNRGRISHGAKTKEAKDAIAALEQDFAGWLAGSDYRIQVEEAYNVAFNGDLPQEFSGEPLEIKLFDQHDGDPEKGIRKKRLHDYQTSTIRQMAEQGRGIVALGVGLGKAQPLDAKILTPTGWKRMGDMQIGDEVINSQGGVSRVTGVFPQGEKEIFEVIMSDGSSTECCDDHLWAVQTGNDRIRRDADVYRVMPLKDFRDSLRTPAGKLRYFIPIVKPIQFKEQELPLDPYLMGIILGDGSTRSGSLDIATGDDEVVAAIANLLPPGVDITHCKKANYRVSVKNKNRLPGGASSGSNPVINALRDLGLWGCRGESKFIPDIYKFASIEQRLALLQGLMDADGGVFFNRTSSYVSFSSTSKRLADDVNFIVQSFGGKAPVYVAHPTYTYKGVKKQGRESYKLNISLPVGFLPFRLARKIADFTERSKFFPSRTIFDVKPVGIKPAQCISVDAPDNLYVTDDCIITHNTSSSIGLALHLKESGRANKPAIVVPKSVLANWVKEIDFWSPDANVMILGQTQQFWANGEPAWEVPGHKVKTKAGNPVVDEGGNYLLTRNDTGESVTLTPAEVEKRSSFAFKDDNRATKERKMQQVSQNAYDLVLMSAPVFQDISLHPDREGEYLDDISQAGSHINRDAKNTHKDLERLEAAKRRLAERSGEKTDNITFEDLGVDCLIHDEAHSLKNLYGTQRSGEVAFLSQAQSNRSLDFYYKARYIREQNNNQNVYLLTATPTTNNPLEAYNMLQHVCPEEFEARGINNIDDFLSMFGKIETVTVPGVDLEMTEKNGLVGFKNLRDLRKLFSKYARMQSAADVGLPIPKEQTQDHYVDMTDTQKELYLDLKARAKEVSGGNSDEGDQDHIFSIISDMDKVAIDLNYYNATNSGRSGQADIPEGERSPKIAACADQVMSSRNANQGKQIVFCDAVQLHEDLKRQLVAAGYPEDEIAIVNAGTVPKSSDRQKISQAYNSGRISLVIGNTATMGEGMNFQIGTTDIHHLTTPWTPAAIEQRNGRGVRQGNELEGVNCHYYHAKGSFDGYRKGVVERKRGWIDDLWRGDSDEADNQNTGGLSMDDIDLMMADDPEEAARRQAANKELQMARHREKMTGTALKAFGQVQTMKLALSKMTPESRSSDRGRALEARLRAATEALGRNEYFPHKDLLDGSTPAYVGTDGTVVKVGDHLQKSDGSVYRVDRVDLTSGKFSTQMVSGSDYNPATIAPDPKEFKFQSVSDRKDYDAVKPISFDKTAHGDRVIGALKSYDAVATMDADTINANRGRILDALKENSGYGRVPYLDKESGMVKEGRLSELPEGAEMLFPHDGDALEHLIKTMAHPHAEAEWKYHGLAQKLTGGRSWHSGLGAELKPRIEAYREQHKAMAEQGPKEGDTRTNSAGNEEVLRGGRWQRVGGDEPTTVSTPEPKSLGGKMAYDSTGSAQSGLEVVKRGILENPAIAASLTGPDKQNAQIAVEKEFDKQVGAIARTHLEFYKEMMDSPRAKARMKQRLFDELWEKGQAGGPMAIEQETMPKVVPAEPESPQPRISEKAVDNALYDFLPRQSMNQIAMGKVKERVMDAIAEMGHEDHIDKAEAAIRVAVARTIRSAVNANHMKAVDENAIANDIATALVSTIAAEPEATPTETPGAPRTPSEAPAPHPDPLKAIRDALVQIEQDDQGDRGRERNDMGWSAFTRDFGRSLAQQVMSGGDLTPNQYRKAWEMLTRRHRPQAGNQATTEELMAALGETYKDVGGEADKGSMKLVGGEIHIKRPYNKTDLDKFRAIPGRRWDKRSEANIIPVSSFKDALEHFPEAEMDIDPAIFEHPSIHEEPEPLSGDGLVKLQGGEYHVSFPYDRATIARIKSLTRGGRKLGRWNGADKTWRFPGDDQTLDILMNEFPGFDLQKTARRYSINGVAYELRRLGNAIALRRAEVSHAI